MERTLHLSFKVDDVEEIRGTVDSLSNTKVETLDQNLNENEDDVLSVISCKPSYDEYGVDLVLSVLSFEPSYDVNDVQLAQPKRTKSQKQNAKAKRKR